jgi:hypothetical protein
MKSKFSLLRLYKFGFAFSMMVSFQFSEDLLAQAVGINTSTPDASAVLDIQSNNKGILIPRVSLTSMTDATAITNPANSLLVWNTNAALLFGAGYYYNSGTPDTPQWLGIQAKKSASFEDKIAFKVSGVGGGSEAIPKNTEITLNFTTEEYDLSNNYAGSIFTVPVGGIYHFDATIHFTNTIEGMTIFNSFISPMYLKLLRNDITMNVDVSYGISLSITSKSQYVGKISTDVKLMQGDQLFLNLSFYPSSGFNNGEFLFVKTDNALSHFNGRLVSADLP